MSDQHFRSHAAHARRAGTANVENLPPLERPSHLLHPESDHVHAMLEQLDDVIFSAILGDAQSLDQARALWPQVVVEIGWEQVEESREQYLRYALEVTRRFETDDIRSPERAISALEVISLLTKN